MQGVALPPAITRCSRPLPPSLTRAVVSPSSVCLEAHSLALQQWSPARLSSLGLSSLPDHSARCRLAAAATCGPHPPVIERQQSVTAPRRLHRGRWWWAVGCLHTRLSLCIDCAALLSRWFNATNLCHYRSGSVSVSRCHSSRFSPSFAGTCAVAEAYNAF